MNINKLILEILNEIENNIVNVAGGKGYGTGKIYPKHTVGVLTLLGPEEPAEHTEQYEFKPVEVSKIFKKEIKDGR
jgi:hypothetical protein